MQRRQTLVGKESNGNGLNRLFVVYFTIPIRRVKSKPVINIARKEFFVILNGRIKINGEWREVKHLRGVLEEERKD